MIVFLACLFVLFPTLALAVPAVIGTPVSQDGGANAVGQLTISATCPSGNSNVIAVACVTVKKSGTSAVDLGAITWNGSGMTAVGAGIVETGSAGVYSQMYVHTSPTCDGNAYNYVINMNTNNLFAVGSILFLKDVNTSSPHDTQAGDFDTTGAPTVDVSSAATDLVIDCVNVRRSDADIAAGTGQTGTVDQTTNATVTNNIEGGMSREAGGTTVTMSWTLGGTTPSWAIVGASFNPAAVVTRKRRAPRYYMKHFEPQLLLPVNLNTIGGLP